MSQPPKPPPPALPSGIRDNHSRGKAGAYVASLLKPGSDVSIVSAFFTIHAYHALKDELDRIARLRFLFGEPKFLGSLDGDRKAAKAFTLTEDGLKLGTQLVQRRLAKDCADWIERTVEIRSVKRTGFLHGKMYHVRNGASADALLGSSNFTLPGLGLRETGNNVELNLVVDGNRDRADLLAWFDDWWADAGLTEDVKAEVLRALARLSANQAPDFVYYLTLFHVFGDVLGGERDADTDLTRLALPETDVWKTLFAFQRDGAKAAINKLRAYNGCVLADSVGLGKTYTALAVVKYFESKNERVLVLCPKKLRRNWTLYRSNSTLNPFLADRFRYDVLSHTDLSREKGQVGDVDLASLNWGNYDLLVIDESHNFRNNPTARRTPGEPPRRTRYEKLVTDVIARGVRTKVLLLSATPVNNELSDLRNQLSCIAGGDVTRDVAADRAFAGSLDIPSVKETTRTAQAEFTRWARRPPRDRKSRDLLKAIGGDFFKLLDGLSIARSRRQIRRYYRDEMAALGGFPDRPAPRSIHSPIDSADRDLSFERLDEGIGRLTLALYNPTKHLRADLPAAIRRSYLDEIMGGFTQAGREKILIGMMKVNFLKRLESSVDSFRLTLERTIDKIDRLEDRFRAFERHLRENPETDYDTLLPGDLDDPESGVDDFTVGGKRKFHLGHIDVPAWRTAVGRDRGQLQELLEMTAVVTVARDEKLARLRAEVAAKWADPTITADGRENCKVLVFTAFADTARYLYDHLRAEVRGRGGHVALVCGDGGNKTTLGGTDYDEILTNFSPRAKRRAEQPHFPQDAEIDVLIATDCISEGQNLQDCDLLINYDIHWNPVRIIQRFGRIDRIGSRNRAVHLVNFWPVADLDRYLNVKHRVEARMALVDLSATQTDNLLEDEQLEDLVAQDLRFRDRQLQRLQHEMLDLEDFEDTVTLTDFTLDEFRADLLHFLEARRAQLEAAPSGLYAVVPAEADVPPARPGVLFCLRQRDAAEDAGQSAPAALNPLGRYYLLYVHDDGEVRLTFAQPKQVLNLWRELAAGRATAYDDLCDLFDVRTRDGADMQHYDGLVNAALASITATFTTRALGGLFAGRGGKLPPAGAVPAVLHDAYELVTWLVILDPDTERSR